MLLGQEFHADLEWWKWALRESHLVDEVSLYSPCRDHTQRDPERHWLPDDTLIWLVGFAQKQECGGDRTELLKN